MNNRNTGRRRSRGGRTNTNRGPNDGNRLDSRARGNAHQLNEKYKGMARDAHQQGDRVMNEYYLQFADHYFRVLTETNQRKDEERQQRDDTRKPNQQDDGQKADGGDDGRQHDSPQPERPKRKPVRARRDEQTAAPAKSDNESDVETIDADRLPASLSVSVTQDGDASGKTNGKAPRKSPVRKASAARASTKPKADDDGTTVEA